MGPRRIKSLILKNLEYFLFVVYKLSFITVTSNSALNEPHREKKGLLQRFSIVQYYKLLFLTSIVFNLTTIANRLYTTLPTVPRNLYWKSPCPYPWRLQTNFGFHQSSVFRDEYSIFENGRQTTYSQGVGDYIHSY